MATGLIPDLAPGVRWRQVHPALEGASHCKSTSAISKMLPRSGHCMVRVPDNQGGGILVFGGYVEADGKRYTTNEVWRYSFNDDAWAAVNTYTKMEDGKRPEPRLVSQAVVVEGMQSAVMWIIGGWNPDSSDGDKNHICSDAWTLDLKTFEWQEMQLLKAGGGEPLATSRHQCAAIGHTIWLHNHRAIDHILTIDTRTGTLDKVLTSGTPPSSRGLHTMTAIGSKLYVFGGAAKSGAMCDDMFQLDTETLTWQELSANESERPTPRCATAATVVGHKIYYWGGATTLPDVQGLVMLDELWVFNTAQCKWSQISLPTDESAPAARNAHHMCRGETATQIAMYGGWRAFVETYGDLWVLDTPDDE